MEQIIKRSLEEYGMAIEGTVYTDPVIRQLSKSYGGGRAAYFVVEIKGETVGGGGIAPLSGADEDVCELQRMFVSGLHRGKGIGYGLLKHCIDFAQKAGYKFCYLESSEKLSDAIRLYERFGFKYLDDKMGDTGHFSCKTYMGMKI
ncbi:GNAT family N-acetyltransferase [Luteibaculum oceani]|nr:GNAT family N-acetyltransferase [Luteibaculum oceani]